MAALEKSIFLKETVPVGYRGEEHDGKASAAAPKTNVEELTAATVVEYVVAAVKQNVRGLKYGSLPVDVDKPLVATEITGSNMNFAWKVSEAGNPDGGAFFVKQAPGYIKVLGKGFPLGGERLLAEVKAMEEYGGPLPFGGIWKGAAPAYVPTLFYGDTGRCVMIAEFLSGHELMRDLLRSGQCSPAAATDVATFMALTHARTHKACAPPGTPPRCSTLANAPMCAITADYVFSKPVSPNDPTNKCSTAIAADARMLRADGDLVRGVQQLREAFMTKKECLIHGDLHTGSIMVPVQSAVDVSDGAAATMDRLAREPHVPSSGKAKIIDAEFAHYGCAAFDVGTFLANLVFAAIASADAATRTSIVAMMSSSWTSYTAAMKAADRSPLTTPAAEAELLQLTAGFAGCELIRRVIGAAHVDDLETIPQPMRKAAAEKAALAIGKDLVKGRTTLRNFDGLLTMVKNGMRSV